MSPVSAFSAALQGIAALMIFIAAFFALAIFAIVCLVAAELFRERATNVLRDELRPVPVETRAWYEIHNERRKAPRPSLLFNR